MGRSRWDKDNLVAESMELFHRHSCTRLNNHPSTSTFNSKILFWTIQLLLPLLNLQYAINTSKLSPYSICNPHFLNSHERPFEPYFFMIELCWYYFVWENKSTLRSTGWVLTLNCHFDRGSIFRKCKLSRCRKLTQCPWLLRQGYKKIWSVRSLPKVILEYNLSYTA